MGKKGILIFFVLLVFFCIPGTLSAEKIIELSTIEWKPYTGTNLLNDGFFSEIVASAFDRVGYTVEFHYYPWRRALEMAISGEVDGVMDLNWTAERERFFEYSDIIWILKEEFLTLKKNPIHFSGSLEELRSFTIASLKGSVSTDILKKANIPTEEVLEYSQCVKMLLAGRVDAVVTTRHNFFHILEEIEPAYDREDIKILSPSFNEYDLFVGFSKEKAHSERVAQDFNTGLRMIQNDGTLEEILKKHHILMP